MSDLGCVFTWGWSTEGTLGLIELVHKNSSSSIVSGNISESWQYVGLPRLLSDPASVLCKQVSSGAFHGIGLSESGKLWSWGRSANGRLGYITNELSVSPPRLIKTPETVNFIQVACGKHHTLALTTKGIVYSWGCGYSGQCGHGNRKDVTEPKPIDVPSVKFISIATGYYQSLAIDSDFKLWSWGTGEDGQLGHGPVKFLPKPKMITFEGSDKICFKFVAAGEWNSLALSTSGTIYLFGNNRYGQLGNGIKDKKKYQSIPLNTPVPVNFTQAAVAGYHVVAISTKGFLYFWGRSLSDTSVVFCEPTPVECPGVRFVQVASSDHHILALSESGGVYAWGAGEYGQLGLGSSQLESKSSPQLLPTLSKGVFQVACGDYISIALVKQEYVEIDLNQVQSPGGSILITKRRKSVKKKLTSGNPNRAGINYQKQEFMEEFKKTQENLDPKKYQEDPSEPGFEEDNSFSTHYGDGSDWSLVLESPPSPETKPGFIRPPPIRRTNPLQKLTLSSPPKKIKIDISDEETGDPKQTSFSTQYESEVTDVSLPDVPTLDIEDDHGQSKSEVSFLVVQNELIQLNQREMQIWQIEENLQKEKLLIIEKRNELLGQLTILAKELKM